METGKDRALLPIVVALLSALLCFCSPLPAYADEIEDDSPAYEVWAGYKDSSITEFNLYHKVVEDLAYRWFMASDAKRAKVPLQSKALGSYRQLSQYAEDYDTPEEQWNAFYADFHPSYIVRMYSLVTYEDSMSTWGVSDSYAYQHFKEWYEWFEGSTSGGGGVEEDGEYVIIPVEQWSTITNPAYANVRYVKIPKEGYDYIVGFAEHLNCIACAVYYSNFDQISIWTYPAEEGYINWNTNGMGYEIQQYFISYIYEMNSCTLEDNGTVLAGGNVIAKTQHTFYGGTNFTDCPMYFKNKNIFGGGIGGGGSEGDSTTNPVYPEPDTPDLPTPSNPIYVDNDNTTTTVDLTPILDALRAINTNIMTGFSAIEDDLTALAEYLGEWQETLWRELRSANAWLERIFYKTSGGGSSDEPDIIIDGDGWWSWLGTIASMLLGDLAGAVSGLGGAFDALHGLFPFSIPWDVAALLGLFVSDPVTPVFDVPLPYGFADGAAQTATVHVDLTYWNGVMSAVRSVELAIFALGLALKTRDMLRNTEVEQ